MGDVVPVVGAPPDLVPAAVAVTVAAVEEAAQRPAQAFARAHLAPPGWGGQRETRIPDPGGERPRPGRPEGRGERRVVRGAVGPRLRGRRVGAPPPPLGEDVQVRQNVPYGAGETDVSIPQPAPSPPDSTRLPRGGTRDQRQEPLSSIGSRCDTGAGDLPGPGEIGGYGH